MTDLNNPRVKALLLLMGFDISVKVQLGLGLIEEVFADDDTIYKVDTNGLWDRDGEYLVLTDSEADEAHKADLENYIDDVVLSELPEQYRHYFDRDKFIKDAEIDGRGNSLSSYDSGEEEEWVGDEPYFIYRRV